MTSNTVKTPHARSADKGLPGNAAKSPSWLDRLRSTLGLRNDAGQPIAAVNQLDHARRLAQALLSERGEASGAVVSRELHEAIGGLVAEDRLKFQRFLAAEFMPDTTMLRAAAETYLSAPMAEAAAALAQAADPPRQELLRRMNMAPGGTAALVAMRKEISGHLRDEPDLKPLDRDLKHLFASWFNRGFLELRRIDWQSPAAVLEKLIAYEAVHEIHGWDDLRRRLAPDRRCFAFFHPALPDDPLIFVEVALVRGIGRSRSAIARRGHRQRSRPESRVACGYRDLLFDLQLPGRPARNFLRQLPDQAGGRGIEKRAAASHPFLNAVTGAGIPAVVGEAAAETNHPDAALLSIWSRRWWRDPRRASRCPAALMRLCATYLTRRASVQEPARSGRPLSSGQWRAPRADQLARQYRPARHSGIIRRHGELSVRPRNNREQS